MPRLPLPDDFPSSDFDTLVGICDALDMAYRKKHGQQASPNWSAFTSAMNGLMYRWSAVDEADKTFRETFALGTPTLVERCREETAMFAFFTNSLSAIELVYYSCYALVALLSPSRFDKIATAPTTLSPKEVTKIFKEAFPTEPITKELKRTLGSAILNSIKSNRDVLSHRGTPPRHFGYRPPSIPGSIDITAPTTIAWQGFNIDASFTKNLRAAVAKVLASLIKEERVFAETHRT